jgi:nucleoside phosphorylase
LKENLVATTKANKHKLESGSLSLKADICLLTVIEAELIAARQILGLTDRDRVKTIGGTNYWIGEIFNRPQNRTFRIALGCVGGAGNYESAAATGDAIMTVRPAIVVLAGIAAGLKGKTKIGQVLFSQRIVQYESAAWVQGEDGQSDVEPRPEIERVSVAIDQDLVAYDKHAAASRVQTACQPLLGHITRLSTAELNRLGLTETEIAYQPVLSVSTIASGEKLLRDESRLRTIKRDTHGKTEAGEMEAAGLIAQCRRNGVPWLVVRGVSDFGDPLKADNFHQIAAARALAAATDFLQEGMWLKLGPR